MFKSGSKLHWVKNLYERVRYGAGCCDVYSLHYYLTPKILKCLKRFRQRIPSHPIGMTAEEWRAVIDEMVWAFEYAENRDFDEPYGELIKNGQRMQKGFELFGKHFRDLWH